MAELVMAVADRDRVLTTDPVYALTSLQVRLWRMDKNACDAVVAAQITELSSIAGDLAASLKSVVQEADRYHREIQQAEQAGAMIGSFDRNDPQGGARGGAVLFGLLKAASSEEQRQRIEARLTWSFAEHDRRWSSCVRAIDARLAQLGIR